MKIVSEESAQQVVKEFEAIGGKMIYGGRMNRRLNSTPFRKAQFLIAYKLMEQGGLKPDYVKDEEHLQELTEVWCSHRA